MSLGRYWLDIWLFWWNISKMLWSIFSCVCTSVRMVFMACFMKHKLQSKQIVKTVQILVLLSLHLLKLSVKWIIRSISMVDTTNSYRYAFISKHYIMILMEAIFAIKKTSCCKPNKHNVEWLEMRRDQIFTILSHIVCHTLNKNLTCSKNTVIIRPNLSVLCVCISFSQLENAC